MKTIEKLHKAIREHFKERTDESLLDDLQTRYDVDDWGFSGTTIACLLFYYDNEEDISDLLKEKSQEMGHSSIDEMLSQNSRSDMLRLSTQRKILMVWITLEEGVRWVAGMKKEKERLLDMLGKVIENAKNKNDL